VALGAVHCDDPDRLGDVVVRGEGEVAERRRHLDVGKGRDQQLAVGADVVEAEVAARRRLGEQLDSGVGLRSELVGILAVLVSVGVDEVGVRGVLVALVPGGRALGTLALAARRRGGGRAVEGVAAEDLSLEAVSASGVDQPGGRLAGGGRDEEGAGLLAQRGPQGRVGLLRLGGEL
jgi:hypothetical protein